MRFFKLNTALLSLIFSVIAEPLFIAANYFFGRISEFGSPLNFFGWLFYWFHIFPSAYLRELGDGLLAIPAWLLQFFRVAIPARRFHSWSVRIHCGSSVLNRLCHLASSLSSQFDSSQASNCFSSSACCWRRVFAPICDKTSSISCLVMPNH